MIIRRAFVREVLHTGGGVTAVMLSIFLVVRLVSVLRLAAEGAVPADSVFLLMTLRVATSMDVILPLMLYVSILMVLARWRRESEMTAIAAAGIGLDRFLLPLVLLLIPFGAAVALFSLYLSPLAVQISQRIEDDFQQRNEITGIVPGAFHETQRGTGVYFVERFDPGTGLYDNVFAYGADGDREAVVVAAHAFQTIDIGTGDQFLVLKDGTRYEGTPGDPDYAVVEFQTYSLRLRDSGPVASTVPVKGMPTARLLHASDRVLRSELHWRVAKIVSIPILMLFALSTGGAGVGRDRTQRLMPAFLIYFGYANLMGFVLALMRKGTVPSGAMTVIHVVFLAIAGYAFMRRAGNRSLVPFTGPGRSRTVPTASPTAR